MPDTDTQGVALDPKGLEAAIIAGRSQGPRDERSTTERVSAAIRAYLSAAPTEVKVKELERRCDGCSGHECGDECAYPGAAAQEGQEAVAWLTEGYSYKRVFLEREAADKLARGSDGTVLPLYTHPAPAQPAAQVMLPNPSSASDIVDRAWIALFGHNTIKTPQRKLLVLAAVRFTQKEISKALTAAKAGEDGRHG